MNKIFKKNIKNLTYYKLYNHCNKEFLAMSVRTLGKCNLLICQVMGLCTDLLKVKWFLKNCGQCPLMHLLTSAFLWFSLVYLPAMAT